MFVKTKRFIAVVLIAMLTLSVLGGVPAHAAGTISLVVDLESSGDTLTYTVTMEGCDTVPGGVRCCEFEFIVPEGQTLIDATLDSQFNALTGWPLTGVAIVRENVAKFAATGISTTAYTGESIVIMQVVCGVDSDYTESEASLAQVKVYDKELDPVACTVVGATYIPPKYYYTVDIMPSKHGKAVTDRESYEEGDAVNVAITPKFGYMASDVKVQTLGGRSVRGYLTDSKYTFDMPNTNVTAEVEYVIPAEVCNRVDCPMCDYTDLDPYSWYHHGVHFCLDNSLMKGYPNNVFGPERTITRAEVVTILWRLAGSVEVDSPSSYKDVGRDQWYADAVDWATFKGVVNGYSAEKFGPNDPITREQMAVIVHRFMQAMGVTLPTVTDKYDFEDIFEVSNWATEGVEAMCYAGIIQGTSATTISPGGNATRAQVATIFYRFAVSMEQ